MSISQNRVAMKRISRDIQNLFSYDFSAGIDSSSGTRSGTAIAASMLAADVQEAGSGMTKIPSSTSLHMGGTGGSRIITTSSSMSGNNEYLFTIRLYVCIHQGPYQGGHFIFYMHIPGNYPFRGVSIMVDQSRPLWHPNVDMDTGRVLLPLEWSPVLTLTSLALAVQMMLLEPSADNPLNLEACSYYCTNPLQFQQCVQRTLTGYTVGNMNFVNMANVSCMCCTSHSEGAVNDDNDNRSMSSDALSRRTGDLGSLSATSHRIPKRNKRQNEYDEDGSEQTSGNSMRVDSEVDTDVVDDILSGEMTAMLDPVPSRDRKRVTPYTAVNSSSTNSRRARIEGSGAVYSNNSSTGISLEQQSSSRRGKRSYDHGSWTSIGDTTNMMNDRGNDTGSCNYATNGPRVVVVDDDNHNNSTLGYYSPVEPNMIGNSTGNFGGQNLRQEQFGYNHQQHQVKANEQNHKRLRLSPESI